MVKAVEPFLSWNCKTIHCMKCNKPIVTLRGWGTKPLCQQCAWKRK
jgi:hypothetical protein